MSYKNIKNPWKKPEFDSSNYVTYELKSENSLVAISVDDNNKIIDLRKGINDFQYITATDKITYFSFEYDKEREIDILNTNSKNVIEANKLIPAPKNINSFDDFKSIMNSIFETENEGEGPTLPDVPKFSNTVFNFKEEVNFHQWFRPRGYANFDDCEFKGKVNFSYLNFEEPTSFIRTEFNDTSLFNDAVFQYKAVFWGAKFIHNVSFENTNFKRLADFWSAIFQMKTDFFKTRFEETVVFSEAYFKEDVSFSFANLGNMIFRQAVFEKGIDLSLVANANSWNGNFFDVKHDFQNIDKSEIKSINQRETFRIIKDQLLKQNNSIEALQYRNLEMKAYNKELKEPENENKYKEKFLMGLNQSNEYGLDYVKPAILLLAFNYLFTGLIIFSQSFSTNNITSFWSPFWELLNPTIQAHDLFEAGTIINSGTYFFFFISRLFLAYFIYQTISAFRKHSK